MDDRREALRGALPRGQFRRLYAVSCEACDAISVVVRGSNDDARQYFHRNGWRKQGGFWKCPGCLAAMSEEASGGDAR